MARAPFEEPTITEQPNSPVGKLKFMHPAYGHIQIHRISGGSTLFGTDFEHRNFIDLEISEAVMYRDLARDWIHDHDKLIRIRMSEAQWAKAISSLNTSGTPCTLIRVMGEDKPQIPLRRQSDVAQTELVEKTKRMVDVIDQTIKDMETSLAGLSGKKREEVLASIRHLRTEMASNIPFYVQLLEEHMETVVEEAKIEVHAYMNNAVREIGLGALTTKAPLSLSSGEV